MIFPVVVDIRAQHGLIARDAARARRSRFCWSRPRPPPRWSAAPPRRLTQIARAVVLIVGSRGNFCTGAALAPDLVLTAAHCVLPGADYKIVEFERGQPQLRDVDARHRASELQSADAARAPRDR